MRKAFPTAHQRPNLRAFTLVEMILVVLIMGIIATLGLDAVANFEAAQRADRACRESLTYFRYARTLSQTTGKKAKVAVDTANKTLAIYWQSNGTTYDATPYSTSANAGGSWTLNINSARELVGTSVAITPSTTTFFEYGPLGTCNETGTVAFTYAGITKSLVVPSVGDPAVQ
jgi:prepilin-type N-terminal cleavage/methylation domain-containing protein